MDEVENIQSRKPLNGLTEPRRWRNWLQMLGLIRQLRAQQI